MMFRVLFFVLIAAVAIGASWLIAGIPGHFVASFGSLTIETSAPIAILGLIVLAGLILLLWQLCGLLLSLPRRGSLWRGRRTRRLGDQTVTRLLVALAADEKREAWKEARRARRLLGDSPYTLMLLAEAGRVSGRDGEAEKAYRTLAGRKDARFLGLQGLLRQAIAREEWPEAMKIARQAEETRPGTAWLRHERAQLALKAENWPEVLELVGDDTRRTAYLLAAADAESDNTRALGFAKKAWRQDANFVPAVLAYADRLRAAGQERKAQSTISKAWQRSPHPDLAALALAPQSASQSDDKQALVQAAKRLTDVNPADPESRMLMARIALDASSPEDARHYIDLLLADEFKQRRLYLLLAELEEVERGDTEAGRLAQREALRQAAVAEPDSHWQCTECRADHASWRPKCTACGNIGTISWLSTPRGGTLPVIQHAPATPITS